MSDNILSALHLWVHFICTSSFQGKNSNPPLHMRKLGCRYSATHWKLYCWQINALEPYVRWHIVIPPFKLLTNIKCHQILCCIFWNDPLHLSTFCVGFWGRIGLGWEHWLESLTAWVQFQPRTMQPHHPTSLCLLVHPSNRVNQSPYHVGCWFMQNTWNRI